MVKTTTWLLMSILFLSFSSAAKWTYLSNYGNVLDISESDKGLKFQHRNSDVIYLSSTNLNKKHYFLRIFTEQLMVEIETKEQLHQAQWIGHSGEIYHSTKLNPITFRTLKLSYPYLIEIVWPKGEKYSLLFDMKLGLISFTNFSKGLSYFIVDAIAFPHTSSKGVRLRLQQTSV